MGHVDGKNRIYDSKGNLFLLKDERLQTKHYLVILNVTKSWRSWFMDSMIAKEAGPFKCFLANLRVVFIRRPNPHKAGACLTTPYGAHEGIAKTYKA